MKLRTFRIGGVHPEENKLTDDAVTQVAALPKQAIFPLSQHIGAPAKPVVKKGDKVKVTLRFRGREMAHKDVGRGVLNSFYEKLEDVAVIDKDAKMEGRSMIMFLTAAK